MMAGFFHRYKAVRPAAVGRLLYNNIIHKALAVIRDQNRPTQNLDTILSKYRQLNKIDLDISLYSPKTEYRYYCINTIILVLVELPIISRTKYFLFFLFFYKLFYRHVVSTRFRGSH